MAAKYDLCTSSDDQHYFNPKAANGKIILTSERYTTKATAIKEQGPWKTVDEVEPATLAWVHWHNTQRLHGYCGDVPPAEFEAAYAARNTDRQLVGNQ